MKTYHITNTSKQLKAVSVRGGFHMVKPGAEEIVENCHPLDAARIRNLAVGGLIVAEPAPEPAPEPKRKRREEPAPEPTTDEATEAE